MTAPDRVLSAAEQDHADALAMRDAHEAQCHGGQCRECADHIGHVERTRQQIELLRVPGETGELW